MIREFRELFSYHNQFVERQAHHDCVNVFGKAMRDLRQTGFTELAGKHVLDLGCGQRFPFALLCASEGAKVTALDLDYVKPAPWPLAFLRVWRHNGLKRALKTIIRRVLFDGRYYDTLEDAAERASRKYSREISFVVADPQSASYPLPDQEFDLIASNAVVEHVKDVFSFAAEVDRLLRSGGYFYAIVHNFYSLSGGHALEWAYPDENPSTKVPPWDHLREKRYPSWQYLNRLKPEEYRTAFAEHLGLLLFEGRDIHHNSGGLEGEQYLTPEIQAELSAYSRELLLTRAWCVICRKD